MPAIELCWGCVQRASLPELIRLAGQQGFATITITPSSYEEALTRGWTGAALRSLLAHSGVRVSYLDGLRSILPGFSTGGGPNEAGASEETCFAIADALAIPAINVVHFGGDPS